MSGFIICTHHEILRGWSKLGGWNGQYIWHKRERSKMPAEFWMEKPEGKDHLEYLSTDGRKMWKWVLIKVGWVHADWIWLRKGTSGSSGHGNELLVSIKFREVLGEMRNCQILKKDSVPLVCQLLFLVWESIKFFKTNRTRCQKGNMKQGMVHAEDSQLWSDLWTSHIPGTCCSCVCVCVVVCVCVCARARARARVRACTDTYYCM